MTIRLGSSNLNTEDCKDLARLTKSARKGTPLESNKSIDDIAKGFERLSTDENYHLLTALDEEENPVGYIYYYLGFSLMAFIGGFLPLVDEKAGSEAVAISLIEASKKDIVENGFTRLEIEMEFPTNAHRSYSERFVELYRKCGFNFAAEEMHMRSDLRAIDLPDIEIPQGYLMKKFSEVSYNQIEETAFHVLQDSKEGLFLSMSQAEREITLQYWFDKSKPCIDDASLILQRDGNVVGFVITRPTDDGLEIGPVGLLPEDRGKGIASYLLASVLGNLKNSGATSVDLDTTVINFPAQKLYRKYGFEDVYYKQFYYWSP